MCREEYTGWRGIYQDLKQQISILDCTKLMLLDYYTLPICPYHKGVDEPIQSNIVFVGAADCRFSNHWSRSQNMAQSLAWSCKVSQVIVSYCGPPIIFQWLTIREGLDREPLLYSKLEKNMIYLTTQMSQTVAWWGTSISNFKTLKKHWRYIGQFEIVTGPWKGATNESQSSTANQLWLYIKRHISDSLPKSKLGTLHLIRSTQHHRHVFNASWPQFFSDL